MSTEIVKQGTQALQDYGDLAVDFGQVAPGYENQGVADTKIPFIKLLQPGSPEVVKKQVKGAQAGDWYNPLTATLYKGDEGILFVFSSTQHKYTRWKPKEAGGGVVGRYEINDPIVLEAKKRAKKWNKLFIDTDGREGEEGDSLAETFYAFGALCDGADPVCPAMIAFKSTMIDAYQKAMGSFRSVVQVVNGRKKSPPLFSHVARFVTTFEEGNGNTWYEPRYQAGLANKDVTLETNDPRFILAYSVYQMVRNNTAKVDFNAEADGATDSSGGAPQSGDDGDPPF